MVFVPLPGIPNHTHVQSTPDTTWTINHNLNRSTLAVDTIINYKGTVQTAIPSEIIFQDANNVIINWTVPRSGTARLA